MVAPNDVVTAVVSSPARGRIQAIDVITDPDKLRRLAPELRDRSGPGT